MKFDEKLAKGVTTAYVAYDDTFFYFAAKIADDSPSTGGVRFADRDDDQYYYPEVSYEVQKDGTRKEYHWPEGVRRYTCRRGPDLPSSGGGDNVQLAFGVFAPGHNGMYAHAPGRAPGHISGKVTDYEYALNVVDPKWGGGTEIWRLWTPGTPNTHFYPRQSKAEHDGGPVADGKLVVKHAGNTRIVEAALPWSELAEVRKCLDAGKPFRFSFRINGNRGATIDFDANRSVSRVNTDAFHDLWAQSWEPQTEFVFGK